MSKIDLLPNEAIIIRDSRVEHDRGGKTVCQYAELLLTNLAIIVIHCSLWGRTLETERFPLEEIILENGRPKVGSGVSPDGERQLHIYFNHGVEAFTLGESDDDEENMEDLVKSIFTSTKEKEMKNISTWQAAITHAVLGDSQFQAPQANERVGIIDSVRGVASAGVSKLAGFASPSNAAHQQPQMQNVTVKCIGCMAPLSGQKGQKTICKYCDTEQVL